MLRILIAEYVALGVLAALARWCSRPLRDGRWPWVFESPFHLPAPALAGLTLLLVALTLAVGLWNSGEVLKRAAGGIERGVRGDAIGYRLSASGRANG